MSILSYFVFEKPLQTVVSLELMSLIIMIFVSTCIPNIRGKKYIANILLVPLFFVEGLAAISQVWVRYLEIFGCFYTPTRAVTGDDMVACIAVVFISGTFSVCLRKVPLVHQAECADENHVAFKTRKSTALYYKYFVSALVFVFATLPSIFVFLKYIFQ